MAVRRVNRVIQVMIGRSQGGLRFRARGYRERHASSCPGCEPPSCCCEEEVILVELIRVARDGVPNTHIYTHINAQMDEPFAGGGQQQLAEHFRILRVRVKALQKLQGGVVWCTPCSTMQFQYCV
jgi:hypothetical protein